MNEEPCLPPDWGKTKYDDMTDEEFEAANPFGPEPPDALRGFSDADKEYFAKLNEQALQQITAPDPVQRR